MSIFIVHQGEGNDSQLWHNAFNGENWAGDQQVPNNGISASPSAVLFNGQLYYFHQGPGQDGQLWYNTSADGQTFAGDQQVPTSA